MAEKVSATFHRPAEATCEMCKKEREVVVVSFDSSQETSAFCWACFRKMLSYRTSKLSGPAQAPSGNGAPTTAGRAS